MAILIKAEHELTRMRLAGRVTYEALEVVRKMIKPGVSTNDLDRAAAEHIRSRGGEASFLKYRGFPKSVCVSVNEEVIHGIPGPRKLKPGDVVSVDIGAYLNGYHGDAARTFLVGDPTQVSEKAKRLVAAVEECFWAGVGQAKHGGHLHDICAAMEESAKKNGCGVLREYCGHGVGKQMHEDPSIPCYKPPGRGARLAKGMVFAIEPMLTTGKGDSRVLADKWTVVTKDGSLSAHYENTFAITDGKPELLTYY